MPKYRFSTLDAGGVLVSSSVIEATSDDEARAIASELLEENHSDAVEVWNVFHLVHRAVRDSSHTLPLIKEEGNVTRPPTPNPRWH